jgi:hypothetical protein
MTLLFAREALVAFAAVVVGVGLFLLLEWRDGRFTAAVESMKGAVARDELPFRYALGYIAFVGPGWFAALVVASRNGLAPMMRHVRVLPISRWRANACLVALAVPLWLGVLIVLSVVSLAATGTVPAFAPGVFVAFIGMTALAHSLGLRNSRPFSLAVIGTVPLAGAAVKTFSLLPPPGDALAAPMVLGLAGLVAAACRNHVLLTRSRSIFGPPSGVDRRSAKA